MTTVGIRELKAHLSEYIARARAGEVIVVTYRGEEIVEMQPRRRIADEDVAAEMVRAGIADWDGELLGPKSPVTGLRPGISVSEIIIEERNR